MKEHNMITTTNADRIRALNDQFRRNMNCGTVMLTRGIAAFDRPALTAILHKISTFTNFTQDNDPYGEHDFGTVEHDGDRIFWRIDAYDRDHRFASPDPADPTVTRRTMTVMLAEEY